MAVDHQRTRISPGEPVVIVLHTPPDVRRWLCPAVLALLKDLGAMPRGAAPILKDALDGGAEPPPHIRRHSRYRPNRYSRRLGRRSRWQTAGRSFEFRVSSSEFPVPSSEFPVSSSEFQVSSLKFRVSSLCVGPAFRNGYAARCEAVAMPRRTRPP